jgi:hypothetical protein
VLVLVLVLVFVVVRPAAGGGAAAAGGAGAWCSWCCWWLCWGWVLVLHRQRVFFGSPLPVLGSVLLWLLQMMQGYH